MERGGNCGDVMGKLTAATAKSLSKPGLHGDGATLYLNVATGDSKSWIQRVTIDGRRRDLGLGPYPAVSLAQARRRAADNRAAIADGRDPLAEKRRAALPTFRQAAELTFEATRPRWRNAKHTTNWMQGLAKYAFPVIGDLRVDRIVREDVLRILTPIWTTRPETARKLRGRSAAERGGRAGAFRNPIVQAPCPSWAHGALRHYVNSVSRAEP